MRFIITALAGIYCLLHTAHGACVGGAGISESLDDWVLGANEPEIRTGTRGDGSTGDYIHIPVGTSPFYYEAMEEGECSITFWVRDNGNCLDNPNPGYPADGPMWGLQTSAYGAVCVGIGRAAYAAGCQGYSPWSTVAPYSYYWFKDGVRASHAHAFTPGWYKWTIAGGWDDITFTLHDVTYEVQDGAPHDDDTFGDCSMTYDATSFAGEWENVFGDGWQALYLKGDAPGGVEPIDVQVTSSSGIFEEVCYDCFSPGTYLPSRNDTIEAGMLYAAMLPGTDASDQIQLQDCPNDMTFGTGNLLQWTPTAADTGTHIISASVNNYTGCPFSSSIYLTITASTSPSRVSLPVNVTLDGIRISGNPFRSAVTVSAPDAILRADVFDADGSLVHCSHPRTARFTWGAGAPVGIYTLRITTDAGTYLKNIVKSGE